ncbi:hypothetical protein EGY08_08580 [Klebsiella sp. FDAARGOS_511]|nr:hypothetical protein EGY08_08580 [Klebsiella sp. FDAARGOS_511]
MSRKFFGYSYQVILIDKVIKCFSERYLICLLYGFNDFALWFCEVNRYCTVFSFFIIHLNEINFSFLAGVFLKHACLSITV